jgi:Protein of unknown function (DUF1203)
MKNFKIVPLSETLASTVRNSKKDMFGNNVMVQLATGRGPCRQSLKPFVPGKDKRILFVHSPFDKPGLYAETGPVFINEAAVETYTDIYRFPPEIKANKESFPLSLIGYNTEDMMVFTCLAGDADVDDLIEKIFNEQPKIAFLHARNSEACCFICKIERIG